MAHANITEHLILILQIRNHIGGIDAGERLVVRILKKRTGTDGYRTLRGLEEGEEVGYQGIRQLRMQEVLQYLFIAGIAQRYRIKVVIHHECIKDVGTEHHRLRNLHGGILILVELRMTLDDIVEESKALPLPPRDPSPMRAKWAYLSNFILSNTATTPKFFI